MLRQCRSRLRCLLAALAPPSSSDRVATFSCASAGSRASGTAASRRSGTAASRASGSFSHALSERPTDDPLYQK
jgi:hypothetical protein